MTSRTAQKDRKTAETDISLKIGLDGEGVSKIDTGIPFFDHMLTLFSKHGLFDLDVKVIGDTDVDAHHTIEDTGIVIGECMKEALGTKEGIRRYGCCYLPMDETLARVVVDLSNRPHLEFRAPAGTPSAPNMPFTLVEEFCRAVASNLRANIHVELLYGRDGHHIAEAIFKGLARALREACEKDARVKGIPSTKEAL
ncbi:MAG: imidazoleglycerol-phosphate dehydratase HisB [Akkermansiaceae bacterium]|jgi:imidazoleglycerol-phosphate dehydratase|nr:imidazoleglycerol-phosphate dehydratase HisB [Akkermansiaceae bacterium]MDP4647077.1 imidazoleglycerol-phosphate dehydratase HisB [Akkermansiaceae bacterium]MDP4719937.1 imidazoleglycerol-phosphate dehydratase HisB [Akkermansiaceae bacterium]MDP4780574.1 imidazoleglycerol-phosphate dehydratase HisB [Akkermansiaceae bacterium]MDP4847420.1 imidazoleglycerol-phosphate dehydratase HisB [Akkermansiaceae bacterium]